MALTKTTASAAIALGDTELTVASATGFAAGYLVKVDDEQMVVQSTYSSGTSIPVRRGQNGTAQVAHPVTANVVVGTASDWANPNATVITAYALSGRRRKVVSYSASGAIAMPSAGEDVVAVLNGTSVLAMTIADPTQDLDGSRLTIIANGAAAHTLTFASGLSGAGSSYDVVTLNGTGPVAIEAMACNALWNAIVAVPMAGTVTNITATVA